MLSCSESDREKEKEKKERKKEGRQTDIQTDKTRAHKYRAQFSYSQTVLNVLLSTKGSATTPRESHKICWRMRGAWEGVPAVRVLQERQPTGRPT